MKTELMQASHPAAVDHAADILRNGGLVAFPTDTIYGVAAQLNNSLSIESLYAARGRRSEKSVGILFANPAELPLFVANVSEGVKRLADHFWPGQLTLILPGNPSLPLHLLQTDSVSPLDQARGIPVAVRIPNHPFALSLLRHSGPLAVSSASRVAGPHPKIAQDIVAQMNGRIHLIIDGGPVPGGQPSTVVDCMGEKVALLRQGPVSFQSVLDIFG
jgi:L-threonylcarbamoyladenylate synthase